MNKPLKYNKYYYECTNCGKQLDDSVIRYLCPECAQKNNDKEPPKGILKTVYHYDKINSSFDNLKKSGFIELLPFSDIAHLPKLKVGETPVYPVQRLNGSLLPFNLYVKDDSQNPTFSFKDRASALVSAYAKENSIKTIITASTGNAGSSLAGICAAQGQQAIIMLPASAPKGKLIQSLMYGAKVIRVKGTYDDAFDLSVAATERYGFYNRNTAYNPLTIEGKKTVSFEIFDQMNQNIPDRIFVPVGDGVIISGVYKGFEDLLKLGIIDKIPVVVAVQSAGSNNLIRNLTNEQFSIKQSNTLADSISVDIPRNFYMTKRFILKYGGEFLDVSDEQIIKASHILAENTGLFAEPAAAAAFAGMLSCHENNLIPDRSNILVLLTGSGLKDLNAYADTIEIPKAVQPDIDKLSGLLK